MASPSYKKTAKKVTLGRFKTKIPRVKGSAKKSAASTYDPARFDYGFKDTASPPLIGRFDDKY